jgi:hypothetical protein
MENERDGFVFYNSFFKAIKTLENEKDIAAFSLAIMEYGLTEKLPNLSGYLQSMFLLIKPQIDASNKRYETCVANGKKGAAFGKRGGRPLNPKSNPRINPKANPKANPLNINTNTNENINRNVSINSSGVSQEQNPPPETTHTHIDFFNLAKEIYQQFADMYQVATETKYDMKDSEIEALASLLDRFGKVSVTFANDGITIYMSLLDRFGKVSVTSKISMLFQGCMNKNLWFTKKGFGAYSVDTIKIRWNELVYMPLTRTPEETEMIEKVRKMEEEKGYTDDKDEDNNEN